MPPQYKMERTRRCTKVLGSMFHIWARMAFRDTQEREDRNQLPDNTFTCIYRQHSMQSNECLEFSLSYNVYCIRWHCAHCTYPHDML
eukprot:5113146-Pleurochrysis_carterae.AAC.1